MGDATVEGTLRMGPVCTEHLAAFGSMPLILDIGDRFGHDVNGGLRSRRRFHLEPEEGLPS